MSSSYQDYKPPITIFICLLSLFLFVGINLDGGESWETYARWGAPSMFDIYEGSYWGLLTNNFVHIEIWHIVFNLYWTWIFGKKIEGEEGSLFYVFLVVTAGLASSFGQLGFASTTGIGLSGIGYAFFGYLFVKDRLDANYQGFLNQSIINVFLVWLVLCIIITKLGWLAIGNAAHIAGMVWGLGLAYGGHWGKIQQGLIGLALMALLATAPWWNPLATSLISYQAYTLHENQQIEEAILLYKKILEKDGDNEFAVENLKILEVNRLSKKAYELHNSQQLEEAKAVYQQILNIEPENDFASDNLKQIQTLQLHQEAGELYMQENYQGAREVLRKILKIDKYDDRANMLLEEWAEY